MFCFEDKTFEKSCMKLRSKAQLSRKIRLKSFSTLSPWIYSYNVYLLVFWYFDFWKSKGKNSSGKSITSKESKTYLIIVQEGVRFWVSNFNNLSLKKFVLYYDTLFLWCSPILFRVGTLRDFWGVYKYENFHL